MIFSNIYKYIITRHPRGQKINKLIYHSSTRYKHYIKITKNLQDKQKINNNEMFQIINQLDKYIYYYNIDLIDIIDNYPFINYYNPILLKYNYISKYLFFLEEI